MQDLENRTIVVAGGTGNVGSFIVKRLLERGATVGVPSRSPEKIQDLKEHLTREVTETDLSRLHTVVGEIGDEHAGNAVVEELMGRLGPFHGALSTLGRWNSVPSLMSAGRADFQPVLDGYLFAHLTAARHLIPAVKDAGGTYVFVNGPLAFDPWGPESALVSIVTAAQHMLFRALAREFKEDPIRLVEVVSYAFIRNRQTQPGSPLTGQDVGDFVAGLMAGTAKRHRGETVHLRSKEQVREPQSMTAE